MAELDVIAESLRRQRKDLDHDRDSTSVRRTETAALLDRIEALRVRSENTRRAYESQPTDSKPGKREE